MAQVARPEVRAQRRRIVDAAIVGGLFVTDLTAQGLAGAGHDVTAPPLGVGPVLLAAASAGVFWWWRRRPLSVQAVSFGLILVAAAAADPGLFTQHTGITLALGAFAVGCWTTHRVAAAASALVLVVLLVSGAVEDGSSFVEACAAGLAAIALPWALGTAARSRRLYVEEVERRLEAAERDRDERARRAVLDERTHIARELHDVVAHHVSLIGVQAGAARTTLATSPADTVVALAAIEAASRSAVGEMRHLLDALRADDAPSDVRPQPGLRELDRLADGFRAAGLDVRLDRRGGGPALPPALDLTCYRIVEEALTNVTRHSGASEATVHVEVGADAVRLDVSDAGPPRPTGNGTGRGLTGMRERVVLFGGRLDVGPVTAGGFAVRAELPRA